MRRDGLFPIGEVSRLFHISVGALRYYDREGLVRPEYTDPSTGYRYYGARQFERLNTIRYLRALDMPLDEIAAFLENRNLDGIRESLCRQREEVRRRQRELLRIERKIERRLEQIRDAVHSELEVIRLEEHPPARLAYLETELFAQDVGALEYSIRLLEEEEDSTAIFLGKVGVGLSARRLEKRQFTPYDVVFVILDEEDSFKGPVMEIPRELCLRVRFKGIHEQACGYYERLLDYAKDHHCRVNGFSKEITMIDYGLTNNPEEFVTEIAIPVSAENGV